MRSRSFARYVPRRPSRHRIRLACQVVRERDFRLIADEMVELSDSGMLVVPKLRVMTGESLIVSFMAPFTRMFLDTEAVVARVIHGRRLGDEGPRLGLELSGMDGMARTILRAQLSELPTIAPRRRALS
jgi:hypothetical protein